MQNNQNGVKGFDISKWQGGNVDMGQAKAQGYQFVYCKSTEGVGYTDPYFATNVANAHKAGLAVGAYHFATPDKNLAVDEANYFIKELKANPTDLMPVLDLEEPATKGSMTGQQLVNWARTFINTVQAALGHKVMLYTGNWFVNMYGIQGLTDIPLWDSVYGSSVPDAGGWTQWTAWQYSDQGHVANISGNVDLDVAESLSALEGGSVPVAQPSGQAVRKLFLPASNQYWTVYHTDKPPVLSNPVNIAGKLEPAYFGGLTYTIISNGLEPDTYIIDTQAFGQVKIFAAPSTGAVITTIYPTPAPAPKPAVAPAPAPQPAPAPVAPKPVAPVAQPKPVVAPTPAPAPVVEPPKPAQPVQPAPVAVDLGTGVSVEASQTKLDSASPIITHVASPQEQLKSAIMAIPAEQRAGLFGALVNVLKDLFNIGG